MKVLRIIALCLVVSLCAGMGYASLLNPGDQINNDNNALGGNAAVRAFNKTASVEVGTSLLSKFSQNTTIRSGQEPNAKGSDTDPAALFEDKFVQGNVKLGMGWLGVSYTKDGLNTRSLKFSADKDVNPNGGTILANSFATTEVLAASYGLDVMKGMSVGVELANNSYMSITKYSVNKNARLSQGGASEGETAYTSLPYTSIALGGIYQLTQQGLLTAGFKTYNPRYMSGKGSNNTCMASGKYDDQYNEELNQELALGYVQKLNNALSLGGTMRMYMSKEYTELRSNNAPETETLVTKLGYTAYTINGEYALSNALALQGYFGWAKDANRIISDQDKEADPVDLTDMGVSVVYTMGDLSINGGLARANRFAKDGFNSTKGSQTDETKVYVGAGLAI